MTVVGRVASRFAFILYWKETSSLTSNAVWFSSLNFLKDFESTFFFRRNDQLLDVSFDVQGEEFQVNIEFARESSKWN